MFKLTQDATIDQLVFRAGRLEVIDFTFNSIKYLSRTLNNTITLKKVDSLGPKDVAIYFLNSSEVVWANGNYDPKLSDILMKDLPAYLKKSER